MILRSSGSSCSGVSATSLVVQTRFDRKSFIHNNDPLLLLRQLRLTTLILVWLVLAVPSLQLLLQQLAVGAPPGFKSSPSILVLLV